jgi:phage terminase small subunit
MMSRGPKQKTARNSRKGTVGIIHHESLAPPDSFTADQQTEYKRLVEELRLNGTLDHVDLSSVEECAYLRVALRAARAGIKGKPTWEQAKLIGLLGTQHRGRLRELGLTVNPKRPILKSGPAGSKRDEAKSPWASKLKVS